MNSLSGMSDHELVALAAANHQDAFACLLGRYSSWIHARAVEKSRLCGSDIVDDLSQEAAIGFLSAVRSYDAAKGVEFQAYVRVCVENVLVSAVRSYVSQKNIPLNNHREFSDSEISGSVLFGLPETAGNPEEFVSVDDRMDQLTRALFSELTDRERSVIDLRMKGYSYEETAAQLGVSVKSVDNAIQRVRQKMKSFQFD